MKKFSNIIIILGVISIMMSACNKEKESTINNNSDQQVWSQEDLDIQNKILSFQDKVKNNSFKSDESMSLDDAIWNLEALMNFNYSNPDSSFVNLSVDTTFEVEIVVNNNMVDATTLSEIALNMEEHIINHLNNMPNGIKFMIATDVYIKDNDMKSGGSKTIGLSTGYGSEYVNNPAAFTPFGANDYWWYGSDVGGCETNTSTTSDAAKEIQYKINNPNYVFDDPTNDSYVVNLTTEFVSADNYPADDYNNDNWLDFLMYYEDNGINNQGYPKEIDGCLEPTEMNYYLQGTLDVIQLRKEELYLQYPYERIEFVYISMESTILVPYGTTNCLHIAEITYGKRVKKVDPIE